MELHVQNETAWVMFSWCVVVAEWKTTSLSVATDVLLTVLVTPPKRIESWLSRFLHYKCRFPVDSDVVSYC
jgi:hypothetical protein